MRVRVNGESTEVDDAATIARLLDSFELPPQRVAVEVNENLVRRQEFDKTQLRDGDQVEIVTLVGGG
jgi:sulfur carrier protein